VWAWLQGVGAGNLKTVVAPLIVIFALTPLIVLLSLLLVATFMGPALSALVAERRFAHLERKRGGSLATSIAWSLGSTVVALLALVISLPLWLVPPLILILPPLIWGWLTYRVMAFDALSEHASTEERREVFRRHRPWLLGIGVLTGYLGAAPSIVWASGALFAAAFVILVPLAIWIYTLVFAFASLWFAHYCLAALERIRAEPPPAGPLPTQAPPPLALADDAGIPPS
jgi:Etoposide-induced protein 2.4 (EI24)